MQEQDFLGSEPGPLQPLGYLPDDGNYCLGERNVADLSGPAMGYFQALLPRSFDLASQGDSGR